MARLEKAKTLFNKLMERIGYIKAIDLSALLGGMIFSQQQGITSTVSYNTLVENYKSWVYTSIEKIAKTVAMLPFRLYVYKKEGKLYNGMNIKSQMRYLEGQYEKRQFLKQQQIERVQIDNHPFLTLYNNPNILDTRFTLTMNIMIRMELAGFCGLYMPKNSLGLPGELWALPLTNTATLKAIPSKQNVIDGYIYQDGTVKTKFDLDILLYMKYPNPRSPFEGMSPLMAQLYPYDIDLYLMQQQYSLLKNKASFGNVFTTEAQLKKEQVKDLVSQISEQFQGALQTGKSIVMHSGLKQDKSITQSAKDMMLKEVAEFARDKLISSYDLSPGKLGLVKDVNRNSLTILDKTFIQECIRPKTMMLEEYFEKFILPKYDEALTLDFILPETTDRKLDLQERKQNLELGYSTINEERSKDEGKEHVSWGDTPILQFNMSPLGESSTVGEGEEKHFKKLDSNFWTKERLTKEYETFIKRVEIRKNILIPIMLKHWKQELKGVLERLEKYGKSIQGHIAGWGIQKRGHWIKENKGKLEDINIDKATQAAILEEITAPSVSIILQDAGNNRLELFGVSEPFVLTDPATEKWLASRLKKFSKSVEGTTFDEIHKILREGFREGLPLNVIAENLKEKFANWEKWRAQEISRTETIAASNTGDLQSVKQAGLEKKLKKFWLNEADARDTHQAAGATYNSDGAIKIDKDFHVGADSMSSPGNGSLAEENVNCRCTLGYVEK